MPVRAAAAFAVFAAGKPVVATAIALLEERGKVDPRLPVAHVFAEFAQHGKHAISVLDVLTHRRGPSRAARTRRRSQQPRPARGRARIPARHAVALVTNGDRGRSALLRDLMPVVHAVRRAFARH